MDVSEAREHLEMIERIVSAASQKLEAGGEFFVCWGIAGAAFDVVDTLAFTGRIPQSWLWSNLAILAVAIAFTIVRSRQYRTKVDRMSLLQREYLNVLWLAIAIAFIANVVGFNLFGWFGQMALWNVVEAMVLFYIGMHGNRRAQVGGIVLIVSLAVANFMHDASGYILAAGVLFGYAGFGLAELLARE